MKIAFILFDGMTFLDFAGFYDVICRLGQFEAGKGLEWDFCGISDEITDELGLTMKTSRVMADLSAYDLVFVPGGLGTRKLRYDELFIDWLRGAAAARYKVSIDLGLYVLSLLAGEEAMRAVKQQMDYPYITQEIVQWP